MQHEERICRQCKNTYTPFRINQDFCTIDCRKAWWEWFWTHAPHKCPACGEMHTPGGGDLVLKIKELIDAEGS